MFRLGDVVAHDGDVWEIIYVYSKYNERDIQRYRLREITKRNNPILIDLVPEGELGHA